MSVVKYIWILVLLVAGSNCKAASNTEELLTLLRLANNNASPKEMMDCLGAPAKVEKNSNKTWWYYMGQSNVTLCWSNKDLQLERLNFKYSNDAKDTFDERAAATLQSGKTELVQAVTLLGTPSSMTIKENRQEVYYQYYNSTLRLFFRDRVLVDYALIGQRRP
jgi:hypothetical protein